MPRQNYTVDFPDGHSQSFDGPAGMSDRDLVQRAQQERKFAGGDIATSFAGGATRHLLEDEPNTVKALLGGAALATGVGSAGTAAIPAAARGLKHLSQFLATGHTDAPTPTDLAWDAGEGLAGGYGGKVLSAGANKVGLTKAAVVDAMKDLPPWMRMLGKASGKGLLLDAATSKPVTQGLEQLGEGLTPDGIRRSFGSVIKGMTPGVEREAAGAVSPRVSDAQSQVSKAVRSLLREADGGAEPLTFERYGGSKSGYDPAGGFGEPAMKLESGFERYGGSKSGFDPAAGFGEAAQPLESGFDRYMPNKSGYVPEAAGAADAVGEAAEPLTSGFERYGGQKSGYDPNGGFGEPALPLESMYGPANVKRMLDEIPASASDWENDFLKSLRQQGERGNGLSERQFNTLDRLHKAAAPVESAAPASMQSLERATGATPMSPQPVQQGNTAAQFANSSPAARAARAAERAAPVSAAEDLGGAADLGDEDKMAALMETPAFRALLGR
jgi:hypothetical protein